MSWQIWKSNDGIWRCVKYYPFRIQAVIWCYLNGYVNDMGRYGLALDDRIKIVGVGKDSPKRKGENKWKNKN